MTKKIEKYAVELDAYECDLILDNAVVFGQLKATLTRMSNNRQSVPIIQMSLEEINELAGWMAAESNHADSRQKAHELGELCDYLNDIEFQIKSHL